MFISRLADLDELTTEQWGKLEEVLVFNRSPFGTIHLSIPSSIVNIQSLKPNKYTHQGTDLLKEQDQYIIDIKSLIICLVLLKETEFNSQVIESIVRDESNSLLEAIKSKATKEEQAKFDDILKRRDSLGKQSLQSLYLFFESFLGDLK